MTLFALVYDPFIRWLHHRLPVPSTVQAYADDTSVSVDDLLKHLPLLHWMFTTLTRASGLKLNKGKGQILVLWERSDVSTVAHLDVVKQLVIACVADFSGMKCLKVVEYLGIFSGPGWSANLWDLCWLRVHERVAVVAAAGHG